MPPLNWNFKEDAAMLQVSEITTQIPAKILYLLILNHMYNDMSVLLAILTDKVPLVIAGGHNRLIADYQNSQCAIGERVSQTEPPWTAIRFDSNCLNVAAKIQQGRSNSIVL